MRVEFVMNNSVAQSNNFKIHITLKVEEIRIDCRLYCEINDVAPSFYLVLSEAYSKSSQRSKMERFAKNS